MLAKLTRNDAAKPCKASELALRRLNQAFLFRLIGGGNKTFAFDLFTCTKI